MRAFLLLCALVTLVSAGTLNDNVFDCNDWTMLFEDGLNDAQPLPSGWVSIPATDPNNVDASLIPTYVPMLNESASWNIATVLNTTRRGATTWSLFEEEGVFQNHTLVSPGIERRRTCMDCSLTVSVISGEEAFSANNSESFSVFVGVNSAEISDMTLVGSDIAPGDAVTDFMYDLTSLNLPGDSSFYLAVRDDSLDGSILQVDELELSCSTCFDNALWNGTECLCEGEGVSYTLSGCTCDYDMDNATYYPFPQLGCTCDGPRSYTPAGCQCMDGATYNANTDSCECSDSDQTYVVGVGCECLSGASYTGGNCVCEGGAIYSSATGCGCTGDALYSLTLGCYCSNDGIYDSVEGCGCGASDASYSTVDGCTCGDERKFNRNLVECECLTGASYEEGKCFCVGPAEEWSYNVNEGCECQSRVATYFEDEGCVSDLSSSGVPSLEMWF